MAETRFIEVFRDSIVKLRDEMTSVVDRSTVVLGVLENILNEAFQDSVISSTDDGPRLVQLPDDTSMLNRLEWVAHFRSVLEALEADKKLANRREYLVNLRTIIDRALSDLDALTTPDPE